MTSNQLRYWELQEEKRKNQAVEAETQRSNLAREKETNRSNLAKELETNRSNLATEGQRAADLLEVQRSNLARETETNRSNLATEHENWRRNILNYRETVRHNKKTESQTDTKLVIDGLNTAARYGEMGAKYIEAVGSVVPG